MLIELPQTRLRNEEHFQHKRATMAILQKYPELNKQLGVVATDFFTLVDDEDSALETLTKSDLTSRIVEMDRRRNQTTRGLFLRIRADTYHFNPALREEAISLQNIKKHYSGITDKSLDEKTAAMHNLLQDLNDRSEALEKLQLKPWVDQLATDNMAVYNLIQERDIEKAGQPASRINEVRPLVDAATKALYEALATFQRLFPEVADVPKCIDELNALNKRFSDRLAQRAGRRDANKRKQESPAEPFDIE